MTVSVTLNDNLPHIRSKVGQKALLQCSISPPTLFDTMYIMSNYMWDSVSKAMRGSPTIRPVPTSLHRFDQPQWRRQQHGTGTMAEWFSRFDWLQWLAMFITVAAAWFTASSREERRRIGFWTFLLSNAVWAWWALQHDAPALLVLQIALAFMNIRGARRNADDDSP